MEVEPLRARREASSQPDHFELPRSNDPADYQFIPAPVLP